MFKKLVLFFAVSLFIFVSFAQADVTITKNDGYSDEIEYYKGKKSATVSEDGIQIFDAGSKKIINVDNEKKMYFETTIEEYKKEMIAYMKGAKDRQIEMTMKETGKSREEVEAMQNEQAEMVKQMMANFNQQAEGQDVKVEKGESKDIAGYKSEQYKILNNGRPVEEIWISTAVEDLITKEVGAATKAELDRFGKEMEAEIQKAVNESMADMGMSAEDMDTPVDNARDEIIEKGYVMQELDLEDDMGMGFGMPENIMAQMSEEDRAEYEAMNAQGMGEVDISITKDKIDPAVFSVPAGYKKVTVQEYFMRQDEELAANNAAAMETLGEMKKADITAIKLCGGLELADNEATPPAELDAILKTKTNNGFEYQGSTTCLFIPPVKIGGGTKFGVKLPSKTITEGSSVQSALFYKGENEYIEVSLDLGKDDDGSTIENYYAMNVSAGGKPEKIKLQGKSGLYATIASGLAGSQVVEINLSENAKLEISLKRLDATQDYSIKLVDWVKTSFDLGKYQTPEWLE